MNLSIYIFNFLYSILLICMITSCAESTLNNILSGGDFDVVDIADQMESEVTDNQDAVVGENNLPDGDLDTDILPEQESLSEQETLDDSIIFKLQPDAIYFGESLPDHTKFRYFLISNIGGASGEITKIELEDDANGAFIINQRSDTTPPFSIDAGYSVAIYMEFRPISGVHEVPSNQVGTVCVLWVDHNEINQKTCIDLLGNVREIKPACIDITPMGGVTGMWGAGHYPGPGILYENSLIDSEIIREVEITNCGDLPLLLFGFTWNEYFTGPPLSDRVFFERPDDFSKDYTLNRDEKLFLPISYFPATVGELNTAAFTFYTNASKCYWVDDGTCPDNNLITVGVSGLAAIGKIEILPSKVDFGMISMDCCSREEEITIYNTGYFGLEISQISIGTGSNYLFDLIDLPNNSEYPIILGGTDHPRSLSFGVKFCPSEEGEHVGRIEIVSNDVSSSEFVIPLKGAGTTLDHQIDIFILPEYPIVDILWVIDCSGSMSEELSKLTDSFADFIEEATTWPADLHIAVTSTDIAAVGAGGSGRFHGSPPFLSSSNMSDLELISKFKSYVTGLTACGGSGESGLQASYLALSEPLISNYNKDFLRQYAKLVIIYVSDEQDQSFAEVPFYINFLKSIKGMRNTAMIEAYAIVGDEPDGCGIAATGSRYIEVADACNPHDDMHFMSICEDDYSSFYTNMADNLQTTSKQLFLSRLADEGTISVKVNDTANSDWEYDSASNSVIFDEALAAGDHIKIEYDTICLQ